MMEEFASLFVDAIKAVVAGGRRVRLTFFSGFALILAAIILATIADYYGLQESWHQPAAGGLAVVGLAFSLLREEGIQEIGGWRLLTTCGSTELTRHADPFIGINRPSSSIGLTPDANSLSRFQGFKTINFLYQYAE